MTDPPRVSSLTLLLWLWLPLLFALFCSSVSVERFAKRRCTLSNHKALASRPLDTDLATLPPGRPARPYASAPIKTAAIKEVEKGVKKNSLIAKDFGIPPNTLSTYLKNKEKVIGSERWLDGFKDRNKISLKSVCGESERVNQQEANQWKTDLEKMIQDQEERDIFNIDETGLCF
ncbi:hypothetical protein J6590_014441 [Homalodisca vitripennis]|nr:hypothetical protein J6590_014441 [Homalodisca vitripennis]